MRAHLLVISLTILAATGCTFRGIPAHGGGKRFDEEQNIVSKSTVDTTNKIDLSALRGKRVRFFILGIGDQGSGSFQAGGWSSSAGVGATAGVVDVFTVKGRPGAAVGTVSGGAKYTDRSNYTAHAIENPRDYAYLTGRLGLQLIRNGVSLARRGEPADAEVYFLVDVFGIDRARFEMLFYSNSYVSASTKITYYAITPDRSKLLVPPRTVGSGASYSLRRLFHVTWVTRGLERCLPDPD